MRCIQRGPLIHPDVIVRNEWAPSVGISGHLRRYAHAFEAASGPLTVEAISLPIHGLADIDRAIASAADRQNAGILFPPDITTAALCDEVVALVARRHLPAIYSDNVFVKSGGLVSYGPDRIDLFRRSASYVDRILRGAKVGGMPLQQPTKYELMVNLKVAKVLGLTVPPTLLTIADTVIE